MAALRTFGVAKSSMEERICEESHYLQEVMDTKEGWKQFLFTYIFFDLLTVHRDSVSSFPCVGKAFDPVPCLNNAVSNIICQIVFGRRFDYNDYDFQAMLKNLTNMAYLEGSIWALVRRG